jgi:hypothetical protein
MGVQMPIRAQVAVHHRQASIQMHPGTVDLQGTG